jgi:hypothetical protein
VRCNRRIDGVKLCGLLAGFEQDAVAGGCIPLLVTKRGVGRVRREQARWEVDPAAQCHGSAICQA